MREFVFGSGAMEIASCACIVSFVAHVATYSLSRDLEAHPPQRPSARDHLPPTAKASEMENSATHVYLGSPALRKRNRKRTGSREG